MALCGNRGQSCRLRFQRNGILKLKTCELWWNGPKFLMSNQYPQRQIPVAVIKDPEKVVHNCVICCEANPTCTDQIMADLPRDKVIKNYPFNVSGVDFCGPFYIKYKGLDNWQKITKIIQLIWKRWSVDYLNSLQQRNKWHFEKKNAKIGDMVILKEDNLPSCQWSLDRINNIYPGKDSKVRVVEVKTTRVHEQMSRFGGLSEERPSVFKTRSKLSTHLSTQCSGDEGRVDLAQPVNRTPDLWCGSTTRSYSVKNKI
ncbi:uncharacterized protein TNCV_2782691 [Trichonephila clavipes]|nr:uncharacterized protein TNCV_2782691 [Trichonephila clavipes]